MIERNGSISTHRACLLGGVGSELGGLGEVGGVVGEVVVVVVVGRGVLEVGRGEEEGRVAGEQRGEGVGHGEVLYRAGLEDLGVRQGKERQMGGGETDRRGGNRDRVTDRRQ